MPADWPDESDGPPDRSDSPLDGSDGPLDGSDGHPDRRDDNSAATHPTRPTHPESDPPSRQDAYVSLRLAVSTEQTTAAHQATATEHAAAEKWNKDAQESRWMWSEYERRWPPEDRPQVDHSDDPPDSWRGEGSRFLSATENSRVDAMYDQIAHCEREKITPLMRDIESQDPSRHLVGIEQSMKGKDRLKEKIYDIKKELNLSADQVTANVPDAIRFTFQYRESHYTQGFWADVSRLEDSGFELLKVKNYWSKDEYKGVNSQWIDRDTGQKFEVQFHTRMSSEAKEITHRAYEQVRARKVDKFEELVLEAFQRKVSADVTIPPGASDIPDYP